MLRFGEYIIYICIYIYVYIYICIYIYVYIYICIYIYVYIYIYGECKCISYQFLYSNKLYLIVIIVV